MPYVITTTDPQHVCLTTPDRCGQEPLITRRAVATLDEARRCVNRAIVDTGMPVAAVLHWQKQTRTSVQRTLESAFGHAMRERGVYTIGPLPDRTVIEVEPCDRFYLLRALGRDEHSSVTTDEIIDAYNAAQAARP